MMEHNSRTSYILLNVDSYPKIFRILLGFVLMEDLELKLKRGPGKITQLLRVLAAFSEDLGSVSSTHLQEQVTPALVPSSGLHGCMHACTHIQSYMPTHKTKIIFKA